jgi:polyisoprenoid-binding protein YceI
MRTPHLLAASALAALCPLAARAADTYQVDPVHSSLVFRIKHMNIGYIYGRFNDLAGGFVFDDKDPAGSSFEFHVKADSVDTANAKRDQHLKSPDFFSVKEFPEISFKSKEVRAGKEEWTYEVTGDLALHGITKPITIKLHHVGSGKDPFGGFRSGFEANFTVKRSDFGMKAMPGLGDDVWVLFGFEGVKK